MTAITIIPDKHEQNVKHWKYTPFVDNDLNAGLDKWVDSVLTIRQGSSDSKSTTIDSEAFCAEITHVRVQADNDKPIMHFYLLLAAATGNGEVCEHALYIHGPHTVLDGRPTARFLGFLVSMIASPNRIPPVSGIDLNCTSDSLQWGSEWTRLPAGPMTASGGPREDWDTKGLELLQKIVKQSEDPTVSKPYVKLDRYDDE